MQLFVVVWSIAFALGACNGGNGDTVLDIVYDPCESVTLVPAADSTTNEVSSIDDALAMWNAIAGADLATGTGASSSHVPIRFELAAPIFHGVYQDEIGDIIINRSIEDRRDRAITIAHELGHAFGLWHEDDHESVMNRGNIDIEPNAQDARALAELWGDCSLR